MQVKYVEISEFTNTVYKKKQAKKLKARLRKIFKQAEVLRSQLMWLENPGQELTSWKELNEYVNNKSKVNKNKEDCLVKENE